jgi:hypothetical protein
VGNESGWDCAKVEWLWGVWGVVGDGCGGGCVVEWLWDDICMCEWASASNTASLDAGASVNPLEGINTSSEAVLLLA